LLADYLRENPATVRIGKGEHGKPYNGFNTMSTGLPSAV
jgi:ribosomal protein L16/L10AE